jgi:hypothetical protein
MEEPQEICQIEPESAVEAACVQPTVDERVMPLDHHEALALEAVHGSVLLLASPSVSKTMADPVRSVSRSLLVPWLWRSVKGIVDSSKANHDQRKASGQQSSAQNRERKAQERVGTAGRMRLVQEVPHATLHH